MDVTENQVEFQWFLSNIVNIVVGKRIFAKKKSSAVISEWVTVSDEALTEDALPDLNDDLYTSFPASKFNRVWSSDSIRVVAFEIIVVLLWNQSVFKFKGLLYLISIW